MREFFAFDPDLVVLAIGENVPALDSEDARRQFKEGVMSILSCALAKRHALVVVRSCFWADAAKDEILNQACQEAGGIFVNAGPARPRGRQRSAFGTILHPRRSCRTPGRPGNESSCRRHR